MGADSLHRIRFVCAAHAAAYTYDQDGNVTSVTDTSRSGTDRQCFTYDYLTRLTEGFTPTGSSCPASPPLATLGGPAPYRTGRPHWPRTW
ncbi:MULTISPECIES: hypothetical protein [unclassified Streptomyces]|uniref:hypothetical protein n=1 Tax=unclassified Streptomyces TaxID=2593676 RepID=UPI0004BD4BB5|nr:MULTISPECIES: hypothetical protein [unclassified Streptomyces]